MCGHAPTCNPDSDRRPARLRPHRHGLRGGQASAVAGQEHPNNSAHPGEGRDPGKIPRSAISLTIRARRRRPSFVTPRARRKRSSPRANPRPQRVLGALGCLGELGVQDLQRLRRRHAGSLAPFQPRLSRVPAFAGMSGVLGTACQALRRSDAGSGTAAAISDTARSSASAAIGLVRWPSTPAAAEA